MFASISGQHVPAFESLRSFNFHFPVIVVMRSENRYPPIPRLFMKHMLDGCHNFRLVGDVAVLCNSTTTAMAVSILPSAHGPTRNGPARQQFILEFEQVRLRRPDLPAT